MTFALSIKDFNDILEETMKDGGNKKQLLVIEIFGNFLQKMA